MLSFKGFGSALDKQLKTRIIKTLRHSDVDKRAIIRHLEHTFMSVFIVSLSEIGGTGGILLDKPFDLLDERGIFSPDFYFAEIVAFALHRSD